MTYFLYWVLMPFVFGIGDMGRANAFRYNVFLTEDWKADLKRLCSTVRYAIFDGQAIAPNVAWEMSLAREMLPPEECSSSPERRRCTPEGGGGLVSWQRS